MRTFLFATLLAALPGASISTIGDAIECYCTDSVGDRVEMGELQCLTIGSRSFMARCEMALNVMIWRETGDSCVTG